jgi:hypothetical protein
MATKKHLAKALRQLSKGTPSIAQTPITRVQVQNGKRCILKPKKGTEARMHGTNPYRRLKRAFKRGELSKLQVVTIKELSKTF